MGLDQATDTSFRGPGGVRCRCRGGMSGASEDLPGVVALLAWSHVTDLRHPMNTAWRRLVGCDPAMAPTTGPGFGGGRLRLAWLVLGLLGGWGGCDRDRSPSVPGPVGEAGADQRTVPANGVAVGGGGLPGSPGKPTFNRDIAPLIYRHCSPCHRPGEPGPFPLLTYADVVKHLTDIVDVTGRRFMPPWLPEPGEFPLEGERRLSEAEIRLMGDWAAGGAPEGRPEDRPPEPVWTQGWQLGPPDLVVTLAEGYTLPADGPDVYRNFVIPVPTSSRRFVKAFEFRPGSRAVHHAFLRIDGSGEARRWDARDAEVGFGGMELPPSAESPAGHFLSWQPGRMPTRVPEGLSWALPAGPDLVLLMHLQPLGRPEALRPSVGFYFTEAAPTNTPIKLGLRSYTLDLPAGSAETVVEEQVVLPVDTELHALLPHAHYLGKRIEGYALFPDGTRKALLTIPSWDFNWQSEFRFVQPVRLPRGTTVGMRYTYDNSEANPRNPHHPPRRVTFGLQTTDEMAELWLQLVAPNPADLGALATTAQARTLRDIEELSRFRLRQDPEDAEATVELGKVRLSRGDPSGAEALFRQALARKPGLDDAHYHLGLSLMARNRLVEAEASFLEALRLNPGHYQARNNAGLCDLRRRRFEEAAAQFREVLRMRPSDEVARENLELVERARRAARR